MEYIIQLDPQTLAALQAGQPIQSDIPPAAGDVRSYRIVLGKTKLPRETPSPQPTTQDRAFSQTAVPNGPLPLTPPSLTPALGAKPHAGEPAIFEEPERKVAARKPQLPAATETSSGASAKPWLPLTLTSLGLFGSLAANIYLGWIAWGFRQRCLNERQPTIAGG